MLSQLVTAARGLFKKPDSADDLTPDQEQPSNMVTATRNSVLSQDGSSRNSPVANGKRKETPSSVADSVDSRPQKRRKSRSSPNDSSSIGTNASSSHEHTKAKRYQVLESVTILSQVDPGSSLSTPAGGQSPIKESKPLPKAGYIRFDSEEPAPADEARKEGNGHNDIAITEDARENPGIGTDDDDSSDDEAPEAFSNAGQLSQLREEERKKEEMKQRQLKLKREKRKEHMERLQNQAASKADALKAAEIRNEVNAKRAQSRASKHEELQSESSKTLSLEPRDSKLALPALLPDEILNAKPPTRPIISAFSMGDFKASKPRHIRLADAVDKPPKDLKVGSTAVRVFSNAGTSLNTTLPPKSSIVSKRVKESWVGGKRNRGANGNLRHTTGVPTSFVRK